MTTLNSQLLELAARHYTGLDSARLNLHLSLLALSEGRESVSEYHALRSIAYSVGTFHPDFWRGFKALYGADTEPHLPEMEEYRLAVEIDENQYLPN
jgi:hypothetical protein